MMNSRKRKRDGRAARRVRGAAVVEVTVCLPVILLFVFASVEACSMVYLKQSLTVSAYEGGRTAIEPGCTSSEVITSCEQVLSDRGVQGAQITITPADITGADVGDYVVVSVVAPCSQNMVGGAWFFGDKQLTGNATFMKEYQ